MRLKCSESAREWRTAPYRSDQHRHFLLHNSLSLSFLSVLAFKLVFTPPPPPPSAPCHFQPCVCVCALFIEIMCVRFVCVCVCVCVCARARARARLCMRVLLSCFVWRCLLIFVCFICLYTIELYNYGYLCIVCFSLSCKALYVSESALKVPSYYYYYIDW